MVAGSRLPLWKANICRKHSYLDGRTPSILCRGGRSGAALPYRGARGVAGLSVPLLLRGRCHEMGYSNFIGSRVPRGSGRPRMVCMEMILAATQIDVTNSWVRRKVVDGVISFNETSSIIDLMIAAHNIEENSHLKIDYLEIRIKF